MPNHRPTLAGLGLAAVLAAALAAPAAATDLPRSVVATKLNNPRGVTFAPNGMLTVAEAGRGGSTCLKKIGCLGFSSAVAQITGTGVRRIAAGIVSGSAPDGSFAGGASDVAFDSVGRPVVVTNGVPPKGVPYKLRRQGTRLARVVGRSFVSLANLAPIEVTANPDQQDVNPNPYGVERVGDVYYVIDAGGNDVLAVDGVRRKVSLAAVLPNPAPRVQPVPTAIASGPDGALYIAELAPGPNVGQVIRLVPGGAPTAVVSGLPSATGIAVAPNGTIYLSLFGTGAPEAAPKTGSVLQIAPDGIQTIIASQLNYPAGMALGADGDLYVSNSSTLTSRAAKRGPFRGLTGEIVRIDLP
jgi:hypothetical protein